jgi:hypothetical protein
MIETIPDAVRGFIVLGFAFYAAPYVLMFIAAWGAAQGVSCPAMGRIDQEWSKDHHSYASRFKRRGWIGFLTVWVLGLPWVLIDLLLL